MRVIGFLFGIFVFIVLYCLGGVLTAWIMQKLFGDDTPSEFEDTKPLIVWPLILMIIMVVCPFILMREIALKIWNQNQKNHEENSSKTESKI